MKSQGQRDSKRQEKELAFALNGKTQKASGALSYASGKGDVRTLGKVRIRAEAKCTTSSWYALQLETIDKIKKEALEGNDDLWVIQLRFQTAQLLLAICDASWFFHYWNSASNPDKRSLEAVTIINNSKSHRLSVNKLNTDAAQSLAMKKVPITTIAFERPSGLREVVAVVDWEIFLKAYGAQNESDN